MSAFPGENGTYVWLPDPLHENLKAGGFKSLSLAEGFIVKSVIQGKDVELVKGVKDGRSSGALIAVIRTLLVTPARAHPRALIITSSHESAKALGETASPLLKNTGIVHSVCSYSEEPSARPSPDLVIATAGKTLEACQRDTIIAEDLNIVVLDEAEKILGENSGCRAHFANAWNSIRHGSFIRILLSVRKEEERQNIFRRCELASGTLIGFMDAPRIQTFPLREKTRSQAVIQILKKWPERRTLVCVKTRWDARTLLADLQAAEIGALIFNNTLDFDARNEALRSYNSTGNSVRVLVVCNIPTSGLHLRDTTQVIYHSLYHPWDVMDSLITQANMDAFVYLLFQTSETPAVQNIMSQFKNDSRLRKSSSSKIESEDRDLSREAAAEAIHPRGRGAVASQTFTLGTGRPSMKLVVSNLPAKSSNLITSFPPELRPQKIESVKKQNNSRHFIFDSVEKATAFAERYDGQPFEGNVLLIGYQVMKQGPNSRDEARSRWWAANTERIGAARR